MATWGGFAQQDHELADAGAKLLTQFGVGLGFLATARKDGGSRVHPVCPILSRKVSTFSFRPSLRRNGTSSGTAGSRSTRTLLRGRRTSRSTVPARSGWSRILRSARRCTAWRATPCGRTRSSSSCGSRGYYTPRGRIGGHRISAPGTEDGRPHRSAVWVRLHSLTGRGAQQQSLCSPAEGLLGMRQF